MHTNMQHAYQHTTAPGAASIQPQLYGSVNSGLSYAVGRPLVFEGYVDDFENSPAAIQFSLDNGTTWTTYPMQDIDPNLGIHWRFEYTPTVAGSYVLKVRSCSQEGVPAQIIESFAFEAAYSPVVEGLQAYGSFGVRPVGARSLGKARLYRSGDLTCIAPSEALVLVNELGVRSIYDIRNTWEVAKAPEPYLAGVRMLAVEPSTELRPQQVGSRLRAGVIGEYGKPEERMIKNYRRYVREYPLIGTVLRSIAAQDSTALVHCRSGKDRTGVLCATALRIAGYSQEYILEDYLFTNTVTAEQTRRERELLGEGMTAGELAILDSFLEARPVYLKAFFAEIDACYGSFDAYVQKGLLMTAAQCSHLAELLN